MTKPDTHARIRRIDELTNEPVLDHDYDGIEELDNPLPGWWKATFYLTIVFAAGYFAWHNIFAGGQVHEMAYRAERAALDAKVAAIEQAKAAAFDPAALAKELADPKLASTGQPVFAAKCVSCHGAQAQGVIGPNLTDNAWINGDGTPAAIFKVVKDGVNEKGMPPWGPLLKEAELKGVVAYVISLKGSNPPGAKPPQGQVAKAN